MHVNRFALLSSNGLPSRNSSRCDIIVLSEAFCLACLLDSPLPRHVSPTCFSTIRNDTGMGYPATSSALRPGYGATAPQRYPMVRPQAGVDATAVVICVYKAPLARFRDVLVKHSLPVFLVPKVSLSRVSYISYGVVKRCGKGLSKSDITLICTLYRMRVTLPEEASQA